jgi:flagellar biosynthesis/type III secretory pathway protein FliH
MSGRLLTAPAVAAEARTLGVADPVLDPAVQARLARLVAEAREVGRREGAAQAAAAADQAAGRVVDAVLRAAADLRAVAAVADAELALRIAGAVLDREPGEDATALLRRVESALAELDDERVTVHLHPDDAAVLERSVERAATRLGVPVDVVADGSLAPGDALLAGCWARADLTRAGAWAAVQGLLEEDADG